MASAEEKEIVAEIEPKSHGNVVKCPAPTAVLTGNVDPRERLSAYFAILAAACGLISDGCECSLLHFRV
jgi:hypothetical protein